MTIKDFKEQRLFAAIRIQELVDTIAREFEEDGILLTAVDIAIRMHKSFGKPINKTICSEVDLKFDI